MQRGWLLDVEVDGPHAVLWLKTEEGEVVDLRERFTPSFYIRPRRGIDAEDLASLLQSHPAVREARPVERYASLEMRRRVEVVEVTVDSARELRKVASWARSLEEVKELYDIDLPSEVRYLYLKGVAPTMEVKWRAKGGVLQELHPIDSLDVEPPPFKTLVLDAFRGQLHKGSIYDGEGRLIGKVEGGEEEVLSWLCGVIDDEDPDIIACRDPRAAAESLERWRRQLGGGAEPRCRVYVELGSYVELGLAGLSERCIFALVPLDLAAEWAPGRLVDSRQSYEAWRRGILLPEKRGGGGYVSTALDLLNRDRGGLVLSPKVGLHENVGVLDFESMFPNIIVRRNVSYETVGPDAVDRPGFLGAFTKRFLERRLYFKHLRERYPEGSREWQWCEQRQQALKICLVCIYGYSGCPVNRFANVRVFQEINRIARETLVKSMSVARRRGFEVVYGDSDSLFVKRPDASGEDYEALAQEIEAATGLPIKFERHFKFLVLLPRSSDPHMKAARRYYGLLTDGRLFYRGIELRRRDTPPYIKRMQEDMMRLLFNAEGIEEVLSRGLPRALDRLREACRELRIGRVKREELRIRKRLWREPRDYRGRPPHVTAARQLEMKGAKPQQGDLVEYVYLDADNRNPYLRVANTELVEHSRRSYDREKYVELAIDAAETLLAPFGYTKEKLLKALDPRVSSLEEEVG